jgi:KAP family P-loop domain
MPVSQDKPMPVSQDKPAAQAGTSYIRARRGLAISLAVFIVGAGLVFFTVLRSSGYDRLPADEQLVNVMASSANGKTLLLLTKKAQRRTFLMSDDSGAHFFRIDSLAASVNDSGDVFFGLTPDERKLLITSDRYIRIVRLPGTDGGQEDSLPLGPDKPEKILFKPRSDETFLIGRSGAVYHFDWRRCTPIRRVDSVNILPVDDIVFDNTGTRLLATQRHPGVLSLTFYKGPNLQDLRQIGSDFRWSDFFFDSTAQSWFGSGGTFLYRLNVDSPALARSASVIWDYNYNIDGFFHDHAGMWYVSKKDSLSRYTAQFQFAEVIRLAYADVIVALAYKGKDLANVLIRNGALGDSTSRYYLYHNQANTWSISPILLRRELSGVYLLIFQIARLIAALSVLVCAYLGYQAFINKTRYDKLVASSREDNELRPMSERPVSDTKQDLLGFKTLAGAIADLIRNPETQLPFTIVVSGSWGSGKSSMMNLIREAVKTKDGSKGMYYTTWFNAWHMQDEQSLLDALLIKLINCYENRLPYVLSSFRLTLAVKRFFRMNWVNQLALGFTLALVLPFVVFGIIKLLVPDSIIQANLQLVDTYWQAQGRILSHDLTNLDFTTFRPYSTFSAIVLGVFSLVFLSKKFTESGLGAFVKLLPKKPFNLEVEARTPGYREEFKKEYWQIMDSARKGSRMVVFIDDIDRIRGEKVLELLEAINFASDTASIPEGVSLRAPNVVFILGMFVQEVAKNLGNQLAQPVANGEPAPDKVLLGSRYIEKMVQMIIPVPFEKGTDTSKLYANEDTAG